MKNTKKSRARLAFALWAAPVFLLAQEQPDPSIAGLEKAASDFIVAYNNKDATAVAALFTENGEITDLQAEDLITGREAIKAHYSEIFAAEDAPSIAIEVSSVRLVAPNLAVEDGSFHLTPGGDENAPPISNTYTATLLKNDAGVWQIASTRRLNDTTDSAGQLADLANTLKGEWTYQDPDGIRLDLAFGWDSSGKFLSGEMLTTAPDAEPQQGTIRIGWDASKKSIVSWMFDADGGFTHGVWTATDDGWLIDSEGTTAAGEVLAASQKLSAENADTLLWHATRRVVAGESLPDKELRLVRPAPEAAQD